VGGGKGGKKREKEKKESPQGPIKEKRNSSTIFPFRVRGRPSAEKKLCNRCDTKKGGEGELVGEGKRMTCLIRILGGREKMGGLRGEGKVQFPPGGGEKGKKWERRDLKTKVKQPPGGEKGRDALAFQQGGQRLREGKGKVHMGA